jgi:S-adenosyl-L-methionine hydrolase (adenosine-forming)
VRLVTLSSDLGSAYAAQMKAVLARTVAPGHVLDLAHDLRRHAVAEAAFVVRAMAARFPAGTVHVVVVDPGVGGRRAPLAVACRDGSALVGPDNGVLVPLAEALGGGTAYRIDPSRLRAPPRIGTTFDGRDLFAPAAATLAGGGRPRQLGSPVRMARLDGPAPRRRSRGAVGSVVHVDHFGNLITDVPSGWVPAGTRQFQFASGRRRRTVPWVTSYEEAGPGRLAALGSSFGTVELAVGEGSAADRLGTQAGASVRFGWPTPRHRPERRKG